MLAPIPDKLGYTYPVIGHRHIRKELRKIRVLIDGHIAAWGRNGNARMGSCALGIWKHPEDVCKID